MYWNEMGQRLKLYLGSVYISGAALSALSLTSNNNRFGPEWFGLTVAAVFVATVNLRLPKTVSTVISMGDVLTILALVQFGPGPALVTYWLQIVVSGISDLYRRHGIHFVQDVAYYKIGFNIALGSVSMWGMHSALSATSLLVLPEPTGRVVTLAAIAVSWFFLNTATLSLAIALQKGQSFYSVWSDGLGLYLLNFVGSAAAAGLISLFYDGSTLILFLCLPIAAVFYQLYSFYVDKFEGAQRHIAELNKLYLETVETLATAVDAKDRYTHGHIRRVQAYGVELAKHMGVTDEKEVMAMRAGALLHDIGKIAIPEFILNKPTVLTESEFEKMKIHPSVGARMLEGIEFPFPVEPLVKSHHERWDGKGYPDGLKGEEIPLSARILSLVDCYDALTTDRPYRSPMKRDEVTEFFQRESGRAYDPAVVDAFLRNLDALEEAGAKVPPPDRDIWGIVSNPTENVRRFESVQPVQAYSKALAVSTDIQTELYSIFEFVRSAQSLQKKDIMEFIGMKLGHLIPFDAAVFYLTDPGRTFVAPGHVIGRLKRTIPENVEIPLEQKLSGWVAANNQALSNLPPFPDFLNFGEPKPSFEISAIAPMNHQGNVIGSLSLYRQEKNKFTDEEFRRLEIVAGQAATALDRAQQRDDPEAALFDELTGLPNGYQLYMMFDQVAMDAERYEYPLTLLAFRIEGMSVMRKRHGHLSTREVIRFVSSHLKSHVRDTDILVRYSEDQFLTLHPKMGPEQAEALKCRVQHELDQHRLPIRQGIDVSPRVSIGLAEFPQEASKIEDLLSIAERRLTEDENVRSMARRTLRFPS